MLRASCHVLEINEFPAWGRGVLGLTPGDCRLFHFLLFSSQNIQIHFFPAWGKMLWAWIRDVLCKLYHVHGDGHIVPFKVLSAVRVSLQSCWWSVVHLFVQLFAFMSSSGFRHDMSTLLWLTVETLETTKPVYNPLAVKQYTYLVLVKLQVDM